MDLSVKIVSRSENLLIDNLIKETYHLVFEKYEFEIRNYNLFDPVLLQEIRLVVSEKFEIEYRNRSNLIALSESSNYQFWY